MRFSKVTLLVAGLAITALGANSAVANVIIDFETEDDFVTTLGNGQKIDTEFGNLLSITSGASTVYGPSTVQHLGAAIFDSDNPGPNVGGPDPDLLVGLGNILILQSKDSPGMTGDFFNTPNDEAGGGKLIFSFVGPPVELFSIDMVDINGNGPATVTLFDDQNLLRRYTLPQHWTHDVDSSPLGYGTLDLTTLADQDGEGGATATAFEIAGFDSASVVRMEVDFSGSAGLDNLTMRAVPLPGAAVLGALGLGAFGVIRRRLN